MNGGGVAARCSRALIAGIGAAEKALQTPPLSDERVHAARKTIKKARAALRLLRSARDHATYKRENKALRDAARCLAALRDAKSLAQAWRALRDRHPDQLLRESYDGLADHLDAKLAAKRRTLVRTPATLQRCVRTLSASRVRVNGRSAEQGVPDVAGDLRRIFRAGRKGMGAASSVATPQALHEWRKQVKYLANALKIVDVSGSHAAKVAARSDGVADKLGEDHDLAELDRYVAGLAMPALGPEDRRMLSRLIERRRAVLQIRAFALGKKIYGEKPGRFVRKLWKQLRDPKR